MVTVILPGSYGKPRPAVIVQSKQLSPTDSTIVCPLTTTIREASFHRIDVLPSKANGLSEHSQIMVDKITALPISKIGARIGQLESETVVQLDEALTLVIGLSG
jgi:mRNA interferase MazF